MNLRILAWVVLSVIWGSTWLFIKIGLKHFPPITFAGIRFAIAILPLCGLAIARGIVIKEYLADWKFIAATGILTFSINYGLIFWGENYINSGLTAILYSTFPLFGFFFAHHYLPDEQVSFQKLAGIILGVVGVGIIFSRQLQIDNAQAVGGAAAIVIAALATAYATVLIKARGNHIDPLVLTIGQMFFGSIPLLVGGIWIEGNPLRFDWNGQAWLSLLYLAIVGSSFTFVVLYWLMQRMHVTKTQLIPFASTLVAVLLGKVVLNETIDWRTAIGASGILLGFVLLSRGFRQAAQSTT